MARVIATGLFLFFFFLGCSDAPALDNLGPDGVEAVFEVSSEDLATVDPTITLQVMPTGVPSEAVVRHGCGRLPLCGGLLGNEVPFEWVGQRVGDPASSGGVTRCILTWRVWSTDQGYFFVGINPADQHGNLARNVSVFQGVRQGYQVKVENFGSGPVQAFFRGLDGSARPTSTSPVAVREYEWQPLRAPSYGSDWHLVVTRPVGPQDLVRISAYCGS